MTASPLKFTLVLLLPLLIIPLAQALAQATTSSTGCFLYEDSPYYCKDISESQAKEECNLQGCNLQTVYKQQFCATLPKEISCAKVLCKSTCTTIPAQDCTAGAVPTGEESLWCQPGCCKYQSLEDTICIGTVNRNSCLQTAKSGQATTYEYLPTSTSCTLECNRGLTNSIKGTINSSKTSIQTKTNPPSDSQPPSTDSPMTTIFLSILIFIILATALVIFKIMQAKKSTSTKTKQKSYAENDPGEKIQQTQPATHHPINPTPQINEVEQSHHPSKKAHELNRLHAFENFKPNHHETNKSAFNKLNKINESKRTSIERLADLNKDNPNSKNTTKSAFNKEKNTSTQTKEPKKSSLDDLRKIASKKRE